MSDGATTYAYDAANRLITATQGTTVSAYRYDGIGNRVAQTVNSSTTRYALDVGGGLYEVIAATTGSNTNRYVQINGQILARNGGTWGYVLPDHLGTVRQITDGTADMAFLQHYEPFGTVKATYGISSSEFGFTGEWEDVTGLVFLRARYYKPNIGRFSTRDLFDGYIEHPYSQHFYQYSYNNPITYADPSGNDPWWCQYPKLGDTQSECEHRYEEGAPEQYTSKPLVLYPQPSPVPTPINVCYNTLEVTPTFPSSSNRVNTMRVQLQQGHEHNYSISIEAMSDQGVTTRQVRDGLEELYNGASTLEWFPFNKLQAWMRRSIIVLSQELKRFPPNGVREENRNILRKEEKYNRKEYRIDIENMKGWNLRE